MTDHLSANSLTAYERAVQIKREVLEAASKGLPFPVEYLRFREIMEEEYTEGIREFERRRDRMRL